MPTPFASQFPAALDTVVSLGEVPLLPAQTTLAADVSAVALAIPLADASRFSTTGVATLVDDLMEPTALEKVIYTAIVAGALIVPSGGRGAYGTSARSWTLSPTTYAAQLVGGESHQVLAAGLIATETAIDQSLISLVWDVPAAESGNKIEIAATCLSYTGQPFLSGLVDVEIRVSDAANDYEPSHTASIGPAASPVGTVMSGAGTATATVRTNSSGQLKVAISEPSPGSRYLWIKGAGHSRLWVRARDGVQQLIFA